VASPLALCVYPDAFAVGASLYGISDLQKLDQYTHKFESKYCDKLLGGSYESIPDVWKARSPLYNAEKIKSPLLVSASAGEQNISGFFTDTSRVRFCKGRTI
jgi:dipeptidyl aminopeptidase/acylaminoacyl peptidase